MFGIENMFLKNLLQKSCLFTFTQEDEFATHLW